MDLFDSLQRWNLWGSWQLPDSFAREQTGEICRYIDTEEVIALIGPRRAGKSTILYQVMTHLLNSKIDVRSILHINFEEPGLSPLLEPKLLDKLYDLYRSKIYPKGTAYIFLDEIQNVPEWERWVRARNDLEDIKIFITGSSSALLSGELASVLTGRNFCFDIYPLSFNELLQFKNIPVPPLPWPNKPPAQIHFALNEYLRWGGFPRVVLAKNDIERERVLRRYLDEILFKDIIQRHKIRNVFALKNIAVHLLTNTSTLVTYKRLADVFQISQDLAKSYVGYLCEAFIINTPEFYSLKAAVRTRNPMNVHAVDLGLRKVASLSASQDETKLIETQVHNMLLRNEHNQLYYWKGDGEIDLVTQDGASITGLYQVAYGGLEQTKVAAREFGALQKAIKLFTHAKPFLITWEVTDELKQQYPEINIMPLWQFLLS